MRLVAKEKQEWLKVLSPRAGLEDVVGALSVSPCWEAHSGCLWNVAIILVPTHFLCSSVC